MSDLEKELVALIKFRPNDYKDHQDYLAALARAADKWFTKHDKDQGIFDNLDDGIANWFEDAISAMNNKGTIPDFQDRELEEPIEPIPDEEEEADEADNEDGANADVQEAEPEGAVTTVVETQDVVETPGAAEGAPATPKPKRGKKPQTPSRYDNITGEKDRYGIVKGTKTHDVVLMYEREQGATCKQIEEAIGGRHYNVLQRLIKDGHTVVKLPGNGFKVTHKADAEGKKHEQDK